MAAALLLVSIILIGIGFGLYRMGSRKEPTVADLLKEQQEEASMPAEKVKSEYEKEAEAERVEHPCLDTDPEYVPQHKEILLPADLAPVWGYRVFDADILKVRATYLDPARAFEASQKAKRRTYRLVKDSKYNMYRFKDDPPKCVRKYTNWTTRVELVRMFHLPDGRYVEAIGFSVVEVTP